MIQPIGSIDFKILALLTPEQARKFRVIPAMLEGGVLYCYAAKGSEVNSGELEFLSGKRIALEIVESALLERHLGRYYPVGQGNVERTKADLKEESDVIRFLRKVFEEAISIGASDIHIERYEHLARIRFRWEGQLIEKYEVPPGMYNAVVSRIKILSELDISERRLPQDGRIFLDSQGQKVDIRVSTLPSKHGEKVVMRLLNRTPSFLELRNLGMKEEELERFSHSLRNANGIILITGPTGSGKTTTLYAGLSLLNTPNVNISTIEDPVEYNIEGINQVQVKEEIGLTFGNALRSFLRQDPDIIMVGEIRDRETAEISIRAALTGHLVFSTLHTNSSWDAVTRLIDMGVEPYLLAASVRLVVAQRLLRQLCRHCKVESKEQIHAKVLERFAIRSYFVPNGCAECHFTGYSRRIAIYEVIPISKSLQEKIKKVELEIEDYLREEGIMTLQGHVAELVRKGETSLEEGMVYLQ